MDKKIGVYHFTADPGLMNVLRHLQVPRLIEWILEAAGYHATANNWGYEQMLKNGQGWVLIRFSLEMDSYPQVFDSVVIDTWVEDLNKMVSSRNFRIHDGHGRVYGYARTTWSLIDLTIRKAVDLTQVVGDLADFAVQVDCPIERQSKFNAVSRENIHHQYTVRFSDIDFNQHTNSCRYVEQILNCFTVDWFKQHQLKRIDMAFMSEILYDETITVCRDLQTSDTTSSVTIYKEMEVEKIACKALLSWS